MKWYELVGAAAAIEGVSWLQRMHQRRVLYAKARAISRARGRPFLVVGKPFGWDAGRDAGPMVPWSRCGAHPCADGGAPSLGDPEGDVTLDIRGVPECKDGMAGDITDLHMFPDGHFGAVFISCTLEHVDDIESAWRELHRVSMRPGEKPAVFVVRPQVWSWFAHFEPSHQWVISESKGGVLRARRRKGAKKKIKMLVNKPTPV